MVQGITRDASFYDNSMLSTYKDCPRKYYLRYQLHWASEGTAIPLVFGLSWHSGQDIIWAHARKVGGQQHLAQLATAAFLETWTGEGMPEQLDLEQIERLSPRTPQVAHEMYANYIQQRWGMLVEAQLLAVEQPFAVPIPGMNNTWYVGRLDKVVEYRGQKLIIEHKTTTAYKKDGGFMSNYVEGWYSDSQVKGYQFGGGLYFPGLSQVWVDAALVHKKEHAHFRFIPVAHQFPLLEEWTIDLRNWVERLILDRDVGYFPKNENSCMGKFGPCIFNDVCRTTPDSHLGALPPEGFKVEKWQPFDLLHLEKLIAGTDEIPPNVPA